MTKAIDLTIDVSEAASLGEAAHIALTVTLPDPALMVDPPIVCFAKPGGGYSRGYFTADLPGPVRGAEADWHAERGWIFVSVDHIGVGGSSLHDGEKLTFTVTAAANQAAEQEILARFADGTLLDGFPKIANPLKLGIGQSMGGCMTVIQQGRYHCYDGIGILGYSAVHTHPKTKPGTLAMTLPWIPRDTLLSQPLVILNQQALAEAAIAEGTASSMAWCFHYDDIDPAVADADIGRIAYLDAPHLPEDLVVPAWGSVTSPRAVAIGCLTPGAIASEAAAVRVPVLVALGERDSTPDPRGEPRAYLSAVSVDLFTCPRMGHMHNFAGTRELFWQRIETWSDWVRAFKAASPQ